MKYCLLFSLYFSLGLNSFAQNFPSLIDKAIESGFKEGKKIPLSLLMDYAQTNSEPQSQFCHKEITQKQFEQDKDPWVFVFGAVVAPGSSGSGDILKDDIKHLKDKDILYWNKELREYLTPEMIRNSSLEELEKLYLKAFGERIQNTWGITREFSSEDLGLDRYTLGITQILSGLESFVPSAAYSSESDMAEFLDDSKLEQSGMSWLNQKIDELSGGDELQRKRIINEMTSLFYDNYYDARNPGSGPSQFGSNTRNALSMAAGLVNGQEEMGGVCDDIATFACRLHCEDKKSNEDCLVVAGNLDAGFANYHFVTLMGNGSGNYTVIDGGDLTKVTGASSIQAFDQGDLAGISNRIIKYNCNQKDKGAREVILLPSELGSVIDQITQSDREEVSSFNSLPSTLKIDPKNIEFVKMAKDYIGKKNEEKKKQVRLSLGHTELQNQAQVFYVATKFSRLVEGGHFDRIFEVDFVNTTSLQNVSSGNNIRNQSTLILNNSIIYHTLKTPHAYLDLGASSKLTLSAGVGITKFDKPNYWGDTKSKGAVFDFQGEGNLMLKGGYSKNKTSISAQYRSNLNLASLNYAKSHGSIGNTIKNIRPKFQYHEIQGNMSYSLSDNIGLFAQIKDFRSSVGSSTEIGLGGNFSIRLKNLGEDLPIRVYAGYVDNSQSGVGKGGTLGNWTPNGGAKYITGEASTNLKFKKEKAPEIDLKIKTNIVTNGSSEFLNPVAPISIGTVIQF